MPVGFVGITFGVTPAPLALGFAVSTVVPTLQSVFDPPGVPSEEPRKLVDSASGLLFVFALPSQTRTTTRFMPAMLVSK